MKTLIQKLAKSSDWYRVVPKDQCENLAYRLALRELVNNNRPLQQEVWAACRENVLFFINTFCFLFEPRPTPQVLPFITYGFQDDAFLTMDRAFGKRDIGIEKSRDLGATWMLLTYYFYRWMFFERTALGLMSRTEDAVDKTGDTDTLYWKIDFLHEHLPRWMKPKIIRTHMRIENVDNKSSIVGSSATGDSFRGGRKTSIGMDEYAAFRPGEDYEARDSTQYATDSRFVVSTPKGPSGAYYDFMHDTNSNMVKIVLCWTMHPTRKRGLYTTERGKLKILDADYKFPSNYKFVLDGKTRSPYYDNECRRPGVTPQSVAQELDRDYGGSGYPFFDVTKLKEIKEKHCLKPFWEGLIGYDPETLEPDVRKVTGAPWKFWTSFMDKPLAHKSYVVGVDISGGGGGDYTSNSVITICDRISCEQVAEFASQDTLPTDLAKLAVAACKLFNNAFLIWEANGTPGAQFTKEVRRLEYGNIFFRNVEGVHTKKKTAKPGWWSDDNLKGAMLGELARAMDSGEIIPRSEKLVEECKQYVFKDGKIVHSRSVVTEDHRARGQAHGDRVIAFGVCRIGMQDRPAEIEREETPDPPVGSMAWRLKELEEERARFEEEQGVYDF